MTLLRMVLAATLVGAAVLVWPRRPAVGLRLVGLWGDAPGDGGASRGPPQPIGPQARRAEGLPPDLVMELVACGLRSGLSVVQALTAAGGAEPPDYLADVIGRLRLGVPADRAWARPPPAFAGLARALILADISGAPAAAVVGRAAADVRAARRERAELAAARLGVRLVLPLGLAVLPGFALLAVVPIVLGLAESVLQTGR